MKDPQISPMVDELGALEKELAPLKCKLARIEALRKALRAAFDDRDPEQVFEVEGERFAYRVGARARERHITSMSKLFSAFGKREFLKRCSLAIKHLEELGKGLDLLEWRNSGPRSLLQWGLPLREESPLPAARAERAA